MLKRTPDKKNPTTTCRQTLSPERISEMIRLKAYDIYCKRGNNIGDAVNDWLVAERKVRRELGLSK